jgi:hypothetical protein
MFPGKQHLFPHLLLWRLSGLWTRRKANCKQTIPSPDIFNGESRAKMEQSRLVVAARTLHVRFLMAIV